MQVVDTSPAIKAPYLPSTTFQGLTNFNLVTKARIIIQVLERRKKFWRAAEVACIVACCITLSNVQRPAPTCRVHRIHMLIAFTGVAFTELSSQKTYLATDSSSEGTFSNHARFSCSFICSVNCAARM